ncbi:Olfactory receptor 958 [Lemmus lemmus]
MYFFLGNLAVFDGCVSQIFFYHTLGCTECFLYTVMAYDRFVAICYPMRYTIIMNYKVCTFFTVGTWLGGFVHNEVDSFFCDIPVVLSLACADSSLAQTVSFTNVGIVALMCFLLILTSYTRIVISILKIHSSEGRHRAFSTCSAHFTSILLFYGPVILVYLRPASSPWLDSVVQVFNNVVTPSLNPLIYSLRNKEVKLALRKVLSQAMQPLGYKE